MLFLCQGRIKDRTARCYSSLVRWLHIRIIPERSYRMWGGSTETVRQEHAALVATVGYTRTDTIAIAMGCWSAVDRELRGPFADPGATEQRLGGNEPQQQRATSERPIVHHHHEQKHKNTLEKNGRKNALKSAERMKNGRAASFSPPPPTS